ncbi:hypothetical protein HUJ04_007476 [Dendroctonus ponderosae]|nr:hypothetical protein HUJ04_007476 [Dendroctonus ponderosae]
MVAKYCLFTNPHKKFTNRERVLVATRSHMNMKKVRGTDEELTFVTEPEMNYYLNAYTLTTIQISTINNEPNKYLSTKPCGFTPKQMYINISTLRLSEETALTQPKRQQDQITAS